MSSFKNLKFGEYTILITHDETDSSLTVSVLDEEQILIETIEITNDNEPDKIGNIINPNLN